MIRWVEATSQDRWEDMKLLHRAAMISLHSTRSATHRNDGQLEGGKVEEDSNGS